jgi:hypothetical protein
MQKPLSVKCARNHLLKPRALVASTELGAEGFSLDLRRTQGRLAAVRTDCRRLAAHPPHTSTALAVGKSYGIRVTPWRLAALHDGQGPRACIASHDQASHAQILCELPQPDLLFLCPYVRAPAVRIRKNCADDETRKQLAGPALMDHSWEL